MLKVSAIGASTLSPGFEIGDIQNLSNDNIKNGEKPSLLGEGTIYSCSPKPMMRSTNLGRSRPTCFHCILWGSLDGWT